MKKNWWKILGIIILFYVFTAGLLIPLNSGILEVDNNRLTTGQQTTLTITGYNTSFTNNNYDVYLKCQDKFIAASSFAVENDQKLQVVLDVPYQLPTPSPYADATIIISDAGHGYSIYPNLRIIQSEENNGLIENQWQESPDFSSAPWKFAFPYRNILVETIRNIFFHVAIWMAMFVLLAAGVFNSVLYLRFSKSKYDHLASSFTYTAIVYGVFGLISGAVWAKFTWGAYWVNDVKLNMTAISLMIYLAYGILRSSIDDHDKKAKSGAIYNIFAFVAMIPLLWIIPRLTSSLHPGNGGNPALGGEDLDSTLRLVFYPAVIGLILLGCWISQIYYRLKSLKEIKLNNLLKSPK